MGSRELNAQTTMKFALVVCFAITIACVAEAKPQWGWARTPQRQSGSSGSGAGQYRFAAPTNFAANRGGFRARSRGVRPSIRRQVGKRSADAKPEADADAWYGYYGYGARPYYGWSGIQRILLGLSSYHQNYKAE